VTENDQQKHSSSFRLAEFDSEFLLGDSMRGERLHLEFAKADERLRKWGIRSTVVIFGSSRVTAGHAGGGGRTDEPAARRERWYEQARRLGRIVSQRGGALSPHDGMRDNVIATGGGPGLMEAANRGAFEIGAPSIGFNIALPTGHEPNPYTTPDLTFQFRSFAIRKMHLAMRAAALVIFPGGFGTFDELFEILTLMQTRKTPAIPVICIDREFWRRAVNFDFLISEGMIHASEMGMLRFAEDAEEAWQLIQAPRA
jgi:uncharacterized protein (TIGR00730 family)